MSKNDVPNRYRKWKIITRFSYGIDAPINWSAHISFIIKDVELIKLYVSFHPVQYGQESDDFKRINTVS